MINYQVDTKGLEEVIKTFAGADKIVQQEFKTAMSKSTEKVASLAKKIAPVGVSGELRASINGKVTLIGSKDVEGVVGSPLPYAIYVEMGTRPHYPPLAPLLLWVTRKLGVADERQAYAIAKGIQRKIGAVGTAANPFLSNAFEMAEPQIEMYFDQALDKITERLAKE